MNKLFDFPSGVLVETTLRCPADCIICPNKKINNRPLDMSWALFQKTVEDCRGKNVKEFCPFIHGEPLSWKFIPKGLEFVSERIPDSPLVIYTNGYLLNSRMTTLILKNNVSELHFSIDGLSKQVYEQHRRGLKYERVISNATNFLMRLRKSNSKICTHVAFTVTPQNEHEVDAFCLFWRGLVDIVDIIPCDGRGGEERSSAFSEGSRLPCFQTTSHTYVLSDGSVVPCCKDWAGYSIMGNITNQSLESIWNSETYKSFRNDIYNGKLPSIEVCRRCAADCL